MMELKVASLAGPKGKHLEKRRYSRWGSNPGSVVLEGIKAKCDVPRVVEAGSLKAHTLQTYERFRAKTELIKRAYRDLIRGISTRRFGKGVVHFVRGYGLSASAVSRKGPRNGISLRLDEGFSVTLSEICALLAITHRTSMLL